MRIAQAIALYAPEFLGGATLVCQRLTRELVARGHVVDVFSGRTTAAEPLGAVRRDPIDDALTWRVNLGGAFHSWSQESYDNPLAQDSFRRFLAQARPDVVHAHSIQALGVGVLEAAATAGVPVIWTMHDWWWLCPCLFRLSPAGAICPPITRPERCSGHRELDFARRRSRLAAALAGVARVLTPSAYLRDSLVANGFPPERVSVQENGIEPASAPHAAASPGHTEAQPPGRALRVVFVGGAGNREKGLGVLLEAAHRLRPGDCELQLYAVDPAEAGERAQALAEAGVRFLPRFAPQALDGVLAEAEVVVVPSIMRESCSLVTREALVRGVPVVTSDCGGPEEVVRHGENGLVVDSGSAAALASALTRLAGDRGLLARLAAAPRPRLATPANQARAAEAVYREVLREASGRVFAPPAARRSLAGKSILFLVGIDGAPLRYRVWHLVEQLTAAGVRCRVLYHSDVAAPSVAAEADCIVLSRAPFSEVVAGVVRLARARRVPVVFSVDDLVFFEAGNDAPALADPRPEIARGFRWTLDAYGRSFAAADAFLGSSEELVAAARSAEIPAYLHRNGLGSALLSQLDAARRRRIAAQDAPPSPGRNPATINIGFLSGTDTHDRDLASIAPALARALERVPCARLVLGGPIAVPDALAGAAQRIERRAFVPWSDLGDLLASLDVSLAPLELPSRFNEAKSEVKFLEASAAGVATIASPSPAFRRATREGTTGLLASDAREWEEAIVHLATDPDLRGDLARRARRDVAARYGPHVQGREIAATFAEILARGPLAGERALPEPIEVDAGSGSTVALEPDCAPYDAYQLGGDLAVALEPGRPVEQSFVCRGDSLARVDLLVATGWRRNRQEVVLTALDESGAERARRSVAAATLADRAWVALDVDPPIAACRDRRVRVRAEAIGAAPDDRIALWHGASELGGLSVGGEPLHGRALAFRSFGEAA